jgi:hypothetical protein
MELLLQTLLIFTAPGYCGGKRQALQIVLWAEN